MSCPDSDASCGCTALTRSMSARAMRDDSTAALSSVGTGETTAAASTMPMTKSDRATEGKMPSALSTPSAQVDDLCTVFTMGVSAK